MRTPSTVITPREWAAYERCNRRLAELANSRPILNPNGPTPLVPALTLAERRAINQRQIERDYGVGKPLTPEEQQVFRATRNALEGDNVREHLGIK